MAFWNKKKDGEESSPPPRQEELARLKPRRLESEAPALERDDITAGAFSIDSLAFRPITLPQLPAPFVDPDRPESRGQPNYDRRAFVDHIRAALLLAVDEFEHLIVAVPSAADSHYAFVYTPDRKILPVWFDSEHADAWFTRLGEGFAPGYELDAGSSGGHGMRSPRLDVQTDPAAFMLARIPQRWIGADDAPAKQQLLDDAMAANTNRSTVDLGLVADTWRALIAATNAQANPPATAAEVAAFETTTGLTLPPELAAMLQIHNGSTDAFGIFTVMSLEQILVEWTSWKQIFDEWPLDQLLGNSSCATGEALGIYTTPRWIPLVQERSGNHAALDLAPSSTGTYGQIIYFGADESHNIRLLASDLADFLQKQLAYVQTYIAEHGAFDDAEGPCFYMS